MKIPIATIEGVAMLLAPYEIDFKKMWQQYQTQEQPSATEWLTLEEAAQFARVSRWTISRWCKQGKLDFRKTNRARCGRIIIRATALCSLIDSFNNPED